LLPFDNNVDESCCKLMQWLCCARQIFCANLILLVVCCCQGQFTMPPGRRAGPMKPPAKVAASVAAASRPLTPPRSRQPSPGSAPTSRMGRDAGPVAATSSSRASRSTAVAESAAAATPQVPRQMLTPIPVAPDVVEISSVSDARCYEVLVPPTLMKKLGLIPGCSFVTIESEDECITCEAGLSLTLSKASIGLHPIVAAIMVGTEATIQKCATVPPPLTCVTATPVPGDVGLEAARLASQSVISSAQFEAVLRRQCQGHVAFLSMSRDYGRH
ncbi:Hypothetical protein, putative, partial [Bodo saltans]